MLSKIAVVAFAAVAAAADWSSQPIPACGWTTTLIYEADHTDTVPIPLASADCSSSMMTMVSPMPVTSAAPPPSSMPAPPSMPPAPPAPMSTMVCNEYVDGQPQCSMAPVPVCSEYVDGQPQCMSTPAPPPVPMPTGVYPTGGYGTGTGGYAMPTGTGGMPMPSSSIVPAIGAAPTSGPVLGLLAAAGFAVALL